MARHKVLIKPLSLGSFDSELRPGVDLDDNAVLRDLLEEDTEINHHR